MAGGIFVSTPRGAVIKTESSEAAIEWKAAYFEQLNLAFSNAQKWLDNRVLTDSNRFIPMQTGALKQSGILGTVIGSGEVAWIAPYAEVNYYRKFEPSKAANPQASRQWFEVAKAAYQDTWINGFAAIVSRGDVL